MTALKTDFQAVLDQSDLAALPRDLQFHPTRNEQPQVLTPAQIEHFNQHGFLMGMRAYAPAEIATIRQYFDELLARVVAAGGDSYSISSAHLISGPQGD